MARALFFPKNLQQPKADDEVDNSTEQLKTMIQVRRGDELAIFPSYSTFVTLIRKLIAKWDASINKLLEEYASITARVFGEALNWCDLKPKHLCNHVQQAVEQALRQVREETNVCLQKVRDAEKRPYTLNISFYDILHKLRTDPLINSLKVLSNNGDHSMKLDSVIALLNSHGVGGQFNEDREAMEIQTAIKAYFEVAKKRVIDNVPMKLQQAFVEPFVDYLSKSLKSPDDELLRNKYRKATQNHHFIVIRHIIKSQNLVYFMLAE